MMKNTFYILTLLFCTSFLIGQEDHKGNQPAFYECSQPIAINKDQITLKPNKLYFEFHTNESPEKLKSKDFVWLEDNPKGFFVGYFVNTTNDSLSIERQDGSLMMIQEALDENGNWKPIEYWTYSGCGNSYFDPLTLKPEECVMVPIKKYSGTFKTKIRLKFKNREKIMYSDPFEGSINPSQFEKETREVHGILYHGPASYFEDN